VPYWTPEQEKQLIELAGQGKSIGELCETFKRSPEALRLKLKRLGVAVPETLKEVETTTTPQQTLPPLKATEDVISAEEALKMWLGCVKRLNEPGLTSLELKRIRLILSALRSYIIVSAEYVEKIQELEERIDKIWTSLTGHYEDKLRLATSEEERAEWQRKLDDMRAEEKKYEKDFTIWPRRFVRPLRQLRS